MKSQKVPSLAQGHIARKQIWALPVPDGIFHSEQAPRLPRQPQPTFPSTIHLCLPKEVGHLLRGHSVTQFGN